MLQNDIPFRRDELSLCLGFDTELLERILSYKKMMNSRPNYCISEDSSTQRVFQVPR